jgi:glucose-1-phosphate thymidylyltransferase
LQILGRGSTWLDTSTHKSLHQASNFIQTLEQRQELKIVCIEEIPYLRGYIDSRQLSYLAESIGKSNYGLYLRKML